MDTEDKFIKWLESQGITRKHAVFETSRLNAARMANIAKSRTDLTKGLEILNEYIYEVSKNIFDESFSQGKTHAN